jgi:hypothetical protein
MTELFVRPDAWSGSYFELGIWLGAGDDTRLTNAMTKLWSHNSINGFYDHKDEEPIDQTRHRAADLGQDL